MRDEIYINNERVDTGSDLISFVYKSNVLSDISKIVGNYSHTIKLPRTARNNRITDGALYPSSKSDFPYRRHPCYVLRDGILMIDNAFAYILSISAENIEIAIIWGLHSFERIKEKTLPEIECEKGLNIVWGLNTEYNAEVDYGYLQHPALNCKFILDAIARDAGVSFDIPEEVAGQISGLFIPVLRREDSPIQSEEGKISITSVTIEEDAYESRQYDGKVCYRLITLHKKFDKAYFNIGLTNIDPASGVYYWPYAYTTYTAIIPINASISFKNVSIVSRMKKKYNNNDNELYLYVANQKEMSEILEPIAYVRLELFEEEISGEYRLCKYKQTYDEIFDVMLSSDSGGNVMFFYVATKNFGIAGASSVNIIPLIELELSKDSEIDIVPSFERIYPYFNTGAVKAYNNYYLIHNLPKIKQIDFLKGLFQMMGLFAYLDKDSIIVREYSELYENESNTYDWSDKLLIRSDYPDNTVYNLENYGQKNHFSYKNSDEVPGSGGFIEIDNTNLEKDVDLIELPFCSARNHNGKASINIYTKKDDEYEYNSTDDAYILSYVEKNGIRYGKFLTSWPDLLDKYYVSFKKMVEKAVTITCTFRLTAIDLKNVKMHIPVYLRQYGHFFAIVEIKTKADNVCEVKLLKL